MRLIVNPAAAGGRLGRSWPRIERRLAALGLGGADTVFTEAPGHATELACQAVTDGHRRVLVAGGDGTACEAAEGLHAAGAGVLGMLPLGTGNDAPRAFGLPSLAAAVAAASNGSTRRVDLIRIGDRVVLNAIGLGLLGDINRRAYNVKVVRGIAVYAAVALVSLIRFPSPRVRLRAPGLEWEGSLTAMAVQNGETTGGGFRLAPGASVDDGRLDLALVPGLGPVGRVPRLVAAMRGTLGRWSGTVEHRAPWLDLEIDTPMPAHLDGNPWQVDPPGVRIEILPGALEVVAGPAGGRVNPDGGMTS